MNILKRVTKVPTSRFITKRSFSFVSCSKYRKEPFLISKSSYSIQEILTAAKLQKTLDENSLVAFYHYHDKASDGWAQLRRDLLHAGIALTIFPNLTSQVYLRQTKYKNIVPFFVSKTITIYSNICPPQKFLKIVSNQSNFVLLGAVYEGTLLGNEQLKALAKLPEKEQLQGQVIGILNQGGNQLLSMLEQSQRVLVNYLTQIFDNKRALIVT